VIKCENDLHKGILVAESIAAAAPEDDDVPEKLPEGMSPILAEIIKGAADRTKDDEKEVDAPAWVKESGELTLDEAKRRARILYARGHAVSTLAHEFGKSQSTIYRWLQQDREELEKFLSGETRFSIAVGEYAQLSQEIAYITRQIEMIHPDGYVRFKNADGEKVEVTGNSPEKMLELKQKLIESRRRCRVDRINLLIKLGIITDDQAKQQAITGGEKVKEEKRRTARRSKEELDREAEELRRQIEGLDDDQDSEGGDE